MASRGKAAGGGGSFVVFLIIALFILAKTGGKVPNFAGGGNHVIASKVKSEASSRLHGVHTPTHATTKPRPSSSVPAKPGAALAALNTIPVKGKSAMTGYSRAQFGPAWTDNNTDLFGHNGCDTRNDLLRRDLTAITIKPATHGCVVLTGTLAEPYTGKTIHFVRGPKSSIIQEDHSVALGNAWVTGAQQWTAAKRVNYANDPLVLISADGPANEQKGDSDASGWLPSNKSFRCRYVAIQVAVKAKYGLWVTPAEKSAMTSVLSACPSEIVPTEPGGAR